jgi:hypothetical protein
VAVDLGLDRLDDIVDLRFCIDKDEAAAVILDKVIDNGGRTPDVAAAYVDKPYLAGSASRRTNSNSWPGTPCT